MGLIVKYACIVYTFLVYCQICLSCHPCWVKNQIHETIFQAVPMKSCNDTQILHRESDTCYNFHPWYPQRGPCGENMVLMESSANPKLGECKCEGNRYPLVYIPKANKCYMMFTQGPCSIGKWLNFENGSVKCGPNPCKDMAGEKPPVIFKGQCVSLDSPCSIGKRTGRVELNERFVPECSLPKLSMLAIGGIGPSHCPSNFFRTPDGARCQEPIYFDFD